MKTLFVGGLVFPGKGPVLEEHAVLIEGGYIVSLAPKAEFVGFDGNKFDVTGGTVMPGLIDCHVHLCLGGEADPGGVSEKLLPGQVVMKALKNAQSSLRGGITGVRDCGGRDYLEFAVRDACNQGHQVGPWIQAAGRMICMTGGHGNNWGRVADGIDDVVKAVREQVHAGSDLIKIMATGGVMTPGVNPEDAHYSADEIAAGITEGKRFNKQTASHAQGADGILNAVRGGIDSIEHGIFLNEYCIEEMIAAEVWLVPTIAALRNIVENKNFGIPDFIVEKTVRVTEKHKKSIKDFYAAGGKIALGTDAGTPFNEHGSNAEELGFMVDFGIKPIDALHFGTASAAALCKQEHTGLIEANKAADLLVVKGDPTVDIKMAAQKENHLLVVRGGSPIEIDGVSDREQIWSRIAAC